ncbi:MAG: hypothetical protein ACE366_08105 [Bradymonadia bacterium]
MQFTRLVVMTGLLWGLVGCGGAVSELRFENAPPVWQVNDRLDVPEKPPEREFARYQYYLDAYLTRNLPRYMSVPVPTHALDVNSFDEVPDSTWFVNRVGVRDVSPDEIRQGPNTDDPEPPWEILSSKVGGKSLGFLIRDARGRRYLLKFDAPGHPEVETGADVVAQRLFWALGYHVPEDSVVFFTPDQLTLKKGAYQKDIFGNKLPLEQAQIDRQMNSLPVMADGRRRALASKFLDGVPIGGYAQEGVREEDPNDTIPHEDRRVIRGQYIFFSWLRHTDIKEDNWLDMWAESPDGKSHYIVHYLLDFGKALGVMSRQNRQPFDGYTYVAMDYPQILASFFSLGLWVRPWEGWTAYRPHGAGDFDIEHFHPGEFKVRQPFTPFLRRDRADDFWGAKLLMRLTEPQIRAAVEMGRYSQQETTDYLVKTLVGRQRKIGSYWFQFMAPLDQFTVKQDTFCFDDLQLLYTLPAWDEDVDLSKTRYTARSYDYAGGSTSWSAEATPNAEGHACLKGLEAASDDHDGYTILEITTTRGDDTMPPVFVHLARPKGEAERPLSVIGIRRESR